MPAIDFEPETKAAIDFAPEIDFQPEHDLSKVKPNAYEAAQLQAGYKPDAMGANDKEFTTALFGQMPSELWAWVNKSIFPEQTPEEKLLSNAKQMMLAEEVSPEPRGEPSERPLLTGKPAAIAEGAIMAGLDLKEFFKTPLGISTMGIGFLPKAAQGVVASAFAVQMGTHTPELARELGTELGKPEDQRDYQKISRVVTTAAINTGLTAVSGVHAKRAFTPEAAGPIRFEVDEAEITRQAERIAPIAPLTSEALKSTVEAAPKVEPLPEGKPTSAGTTDAPPVLEPQTQEAYGVYPKAEKLFQADKRKSGEISGVEASAGADKAEIVKRPAEAIPIGSSVSELKAPPQARATAPSAQGGDVTVRQQSTAPKAEGAGDTVTQPIRVTRGLRARKVFDRETEIQGPDVLSWISENMRMESRTSARVSRGKEWWSKNNSLYDDAAPLQRPHHNIIYGGKSSPDQVAQAAYDAGVLKSPDVPELWMAIRESSNVRAKAFSSLRSQEAALQNEILAHNDWLKATSQGETRIAADELKIGDLMDVEGEKVEVTGISPDTGEVTLKDGKKFGVQRLQSGQSIHVENYVEQPAVVDFVGMGGAVPSEFEVSPKTPTSIKNAKVDVERQQRGLPPAIEPAKRSFGKVWDEAMAKVDTDPAYPDRLINELRDKPRSLTDAEDATLLQRQIEIQNEYGKVTRDLAQAFDDSKQFPNRLEDVAELQVRTAELSNKLLDLYNINKKVGTETGRGLNARKMMANEDFTLAKMEIERRAANGGRPLTDAERSEVTELNKKIESTQKAYDDYVSKNDARNAELEVKRALDEVERQAKKEPTYPPEVLSTAERIVRGFEKRADAATIRLKQKLAQLGSAPDPTIVIDLAEIGVAKLGRAALDFTKWAAAMRSHLGEEFASKVEPFLQEAFEASRKMLESDLSKMKVPDKVKRAVKKLDVSEQTQAAKDTIKERISSGQRNEITGQVQKLARLFVEQGVKRRDELIDAVHEALLEIDPKFTRREAMDAISGYGDFKQLTKDEISVQLRDLKGQMQQVAKLEDMQAGKPPLKTGVERRIPSPEESRLIKQVNEAKNKFQIPITDEATQLKSSLDTLKTRLKNRTTELQDKLARGDFKKTPKRIVQMDAEANKLHFEATKAKIAWHEALMKDRLANRNIPQKILGAMAEAWNTSRAILTSVDLSAVLRQAGFIAFGHPIRAIKSFPAMFKAFRSEVSQHAVNQEIVGRKNYPLYNQSKLYLSEHGQKLSQMEEAYMSRWADKIPLVAGSQRAYVTFLNKLRADSFDAMANSLSRSGELTPVEANAISNFINVATGRGNIGMKENALVGLNTVFFAPRYVASRFQLIVGQPLYRGSARTRTLIAKEYARYLIGVGVVYGLATLDGAEVEQDPRSSDFGKLRYGNTRLDPLSGLTQTTVLLSRLATGETKTLRGNVVPIRGEKVPFGSGNSADVIARFLRSKLAPVPSQGVNVLAGKDVVGQPVTAESVTEGLLVPLAFRDVYDAMIEQGVPRGTAFALLSMFGMGLQTYETKKKE